MDLKSLQKVLVVVGSNFARPKTPIITLQPAPPTEITSRRIFQMESKYLGGAKRGSSDCSALRATIFTAKPEWKLGTILRNLGLAFITTQALVRSGSGFKKKELTRLRLELKTFSVVISCSIVELVLVEGELPL
jgi:hypothetical protein